MEMLPEVEPELEEAELQEEEAEQEEEEGGEDGGLSELRELEETLAKVQIAPSAEADSSKLPVSYRENSAKEKLLQTMADNFNCQYSYLYPDRTPLLLCPLNECGVQKFVSTTLRPTLLPYPEIYHWQGCANVISIISFCCLKGTCFEFSTLLCSLLLGAGYNAYCVSGYAMKEMCLLNQNRQECPLLKPQVKEEKRKYTVKPPHDLYSRFEKRQEQNRQEEARVALLSQQQEAQRLQEVERERPPPDPLLGLRVHCWVLVLSGNREVPENFFIDPLAGQSYPTTSEKFLGIESIWNHQNYWVNMQDCRFGCTEMTFDLGNPVKWEYLLRGSTSHNILLNSDTKTQNDQEDEEEEDVCTQYMESRYPGGTKLIQYRQATVEKFAPYLMKDGLITRLTTYNDLDCTHPNTVTEWYKDRHDHLDERELEKATGLTTEHFRPGRSYALKCHRYVTLIPETERQMDFYSRFRVDDLASRVETPSEMTETFENRPDFLYHRQVVYDKQVLPFEPAENAKQVRRPIKKVVEKFHRDHSKAASEDVAKRVFLLKEDQIQVTYHLEEDRSIPAWRISSNLVTGRTHSLHSWPPPFRLVRAILDARQQEESGITLQISIYDTARNEKKRLAEEELLNKEEKELDILAPFLAKLGNPASLTREQVQQLVADCLAEMKQRLVDRANLIQARFEKETQELQQKQQWYQKNQLTMAKEDEDAYLAYCSDAMFRIHVVKLRLNRHKDKAPQMYLALRDKLRRDPRLIQHLW
uniref:Dynein regulatory complex subunit 7 n=1 Tax=Astyanax mexicanus TaxID=7994 RepID=W5KQ75_ASTMX